MTSSTPLLEAKNIRKRFPGVLALDGVSLSVQPGEVLALIGENGAGKSTLMKILAGIYTPDQGELLLDGQPLKLGGVADALRRGLVLIHQELNLADNLSVAANLFLGREHTRGGILGWLDRAGMRREALRLLERVGLEVSPETLVGDLALGQQQMVEIARALSLSARLIIMDEPTSSLTQRETERLFEVIADLKRAGVAVVYISHRLAEVQRIADRVTVLRDGRNSGELARDEITHEAMVQRMVGRDLQQFFQRTHPEPDALASLPVRLEVRQVRYAGGPATPISLSVRGGEMVGVAGLVGAGRTELAETLFGIRTLVAGAVLLDGQRVSLRSPGDAIAQGLLLAPEDRRLHGLVLAESVLHNISLPNLDRVSSGRLVQPVRERALGRETCDRLRVKTPRLGQPVGLLSGGNQQKVVVGKWLARAPKVLIFDEPTRGVDVGAKSEIYALMDEQARRGVAILMISSDLEEILGMSDRVIVFHQGAPAGELSRAELSEQAIMRLATGGGRRAEAAVEEKTAGVSPPRAEYKGRNETNMVRHH
ncbi:MAG: sugar ABC transporter ATP-binding protein, partial [Planctomycetia bacterium]|nr:sugar ABC transporter ATP-binding protein [Planctomycetia bacterium]